MHVILCICEVLVIIGGLNWGLIGFCDFNLVQAITGSYVGIANIVYSLVGIASLIIIILAIRGECLCFPRCKCNKDQDMQDEH